ncbi:hypothetical protein BDF19DRAFT_423679 [Syncephalis fuscata]|nr:hypothetical protein BDF19DRAFT_423679 [Syncephalis fuscata]
MLLGASSSHDGHFQAQRHFCAIKPSTIKNVSVLLVLLLLPLQTVMADMFNFTILPFAVAGICSKNNLKSIVYEARIMAPGASMVWVMDRFNFDNITKTRPITRVNSTYTPQPVNVYPEISCGSGNGNITICRRDSGKSELQFTSSDHRLCVVIMNRISRHSLNVSIHTDFAIDTDLAYSSSPSRHLWRIDSLSMLGLGWIMAILGMFLLH